MNNSLDLHVSAYEGNIQYDFDNEILLNWYPKRVIDSTNNSNSLLELGLGHGYTTNIFSGHFSKHLVLEGSEAVIKNFKIKYPDSQCEIINILFEDFSDDGYYDVIVLGFILEHVDDPLEILKHFRKFLNPNGGKMFVTVPNAEVLNRRLGHIAGILPDILALSENDRNLGHQRYYTVETLREDINKAGYEVKRLEGIYLKPFTTSQVLSLQLDRKIIDALCLVGIEYPELSCGILA